MDATSIKSSMGQQVRLLNQIDELMKHCQKNGLNNDVAEEDMRVLETYVGTMRKACDVVNLLADKATADEDRGKVAEKLDSPKAVKSVDKKPREKKKVVLEEDDLDFLD